MKNLITYISPHKDFDEESKVLIKVQIDNSLDLGWKKEDILLFTNFPYEYNGIASVVVGDDGYCSYCPISTKTTAIVKLFENGLIEKGQLYWSHDPDAYQLEIIHESDISSDMGSADMALCDYGRRPKWNGGSIFFRDSARDIYEKTKELMDAYKTLGRHLVFDEVSLYTLTNSDEEIRKRIKKLNITYNFQSFNIRSCIKMVEKPIKVTHFHPLREQKQLSIKKPLEWFMGMNKINTPLITERLINIFKYHGIV